MLKNDFNVQGLFTAAIIAFFRLEEYYKLFGIVPLAYGKQQELIFDICTLVYNAINLNAIN